MRNAELTIGIYCVKLPKSSSIYGKLNIPSKVPGEPDHDNKNHTEKEREEESERNVTYCTAGQTTKVS